MINLNTEELTKLEASRPLVWLEQLTVENLIGKNSNLNFFGEQLKELERKKKLKGKTKK